jgi:hypothetical protein
VVSVRDAWLQAERQQETGGNYGYNRPGCYGAYCWNALSNWQSDASKTGYGQYANTPPANVPTWVQDAVAWGVMGPYVSKGQYSQAAEVWNGGVPYPIPNPALCPGCTSGTYAQEVIAKFKAILGGKVPPSSGTGGVSTTGVGPQLNPLQYLANPFGSFLQDLASASGAASVKDMLVRTGLILLGAALIIVGVITLVAKPASKAANIGLSFAAPEARGVEGAARSVGRSRAQEQSAERIRARRRESMEARASERAAIRQERTEDRAVRRREKAET